MANIVPPQETPIQLRIMRRAKTRRCSQLCLAFCVIAVGVLIARLEFGDRLPIWAPLIGVACVGLAVVAALGAVAYRFVETPEEVTVTSTFRWPRHGEVLWLKRKE